MVPYRLGEGLDLVAARAAAEIPPSVEGGWRLFGVQSINRRTMTYTLIMTDEPLEEEKQIDYEALDNLE